MLAQVRVRIVYIKFHTIIVETLGETSKRFALPRIRFKVSLPFGKIFKIVRTQFPLRVAYCLTLNKSQSQTFDKAVVDVTHEPFCHGQLYVAVSRVRESDNIFLFCRDTQILEQCMWWCITHQHCISFASSVANRLLYP